LLQRREDQETDEFKEKYKKRAGVEGTISQGIRRCDMRQSRYIGLDKTHLQHVITAAALNLIRVIEWFLDPNFAQTRKSCFAALAP
jgi:transposase